MKHHVYMIEFTRVWPSFEEQLVALFDGRDISEEEVHEITHEDRYDSRVVVMSKKQYDTVFRSLKGE